MDISEWSLQIRTWTVLNIETVRFRLFVQQHEIVHPLRNPLGGRRNWDFVVIFYTGRGIFGPGLLIQGGGGHKLEWSYYR